MTPTRYFYARIGQAFGFHRKTLRMSDAASEMHLLREAESYLGAAVWDKVESIDDLSVEYWNLRKLIKQQKEAQTRLDECQSRLDLAHEERASLLLASTEPHQDLLDQRVNILKDLEKLAIQRDEIIANARRIRRAYDGMKMKLEVITKEAAENTTQEETAKVKSRLADLKAEFTDLKSKRDAIARQIDAGDEKVNEIDSKLDERRKERRSDTSQAFVVIGEANKEVSSLRAELGLIENQITQLHSEIGRYLSRHAAQDPACAHACRSHRGLVEVMRALRRSIALNHRLAGIS